MTRGPGSLLVHARRRLIRGPGSLIVHPSAIHACRAIGRWFFQHSLGAARKGDSEPSLFKRTTISVRPSDFSGLEKGKRCPCCVRAGVVDRQALCPAVTNCSVVKLASAAAQLQARPGGIDYRPRDPSVVVSITYQRRFTFVKPQALCPRPSHGAAGPVSAIEWWSRFPCARVRIKESQGERRCIRVRVVERLVLNPRQSLGASGHVPA